VVDMPRPVAIRATTYPTRGRKFFCTLDEFSTMELHGGTPVANPVAFKYVHDIRLPPPGRIRHSPPLRRPEPEDGGSTAWPRLIAVESD